jgi:hypothetical protein
MILTQKENKRDWGTTTESIANVPILKQAITRCSTKAHHDMLSFKHVIFYLLFILASITPNYTNMTTLYLRILF